MTTKRIVLIILCVLLAVMVVLFAVVGSRFAPLLTLLKGPAGQTKPPAGTTTVTPGTTVPPQTTVPTTQPPTTVPEDTTPTEPGHEHEYFVSKVVEVSCGTPGYTVYKCECGKTDIRDYVEGISHSYSTGTKVSATCEEQGYTEFICSNCGYADRRNYVDPIGHDYVLEKTETPTCVQDGYDLYKCQNCDGEKKENEVIANGHICESWTETTPPGPGQPGEESGVCTVCGETVTRPCELEIRGIIPTQYDTYHSYTVYVGTRETNRAVTYIINDYSCSNKIGFTYRAGGLVVKYNGVELTTLQALQELTLTIDESGQMVVGDPSDPTDPSEPTEPSTPAEPSDPLEPSEPIGEEVEE